MHANRYFRAPCSSSFPSSHCLFFAIQSLRNSVELFSSTGLIMSGRVSPSSRIQMATPSGWFVLAIILRPTSRRSKYNDWGVAWIISACAELPTAYLIWKWLIASCWVSSMYTRHDRKCMFAVCATWFHTTISTISINLQYFPCRVCLVLHCSTLMLQAIW